MADIDSWRNDPYLPTIRLRYRPWRLSFTPKGDTTSELLRNDHVFLGERIDRCWATRVILKRGEGVRAADIGLLHFRQQRPLAERAGVRSRTTQLYEGYLAVPPAFESMRAITSSEIWTLYGVGSGAPVSAFVVPHTAFAGYCSQASCQMALLNLMNEQEGILPACLGSFDITRIAHGAAGQKHAREFKLDGLSPWQMREVLRSSHSNVNGLLEVLPNDDEAALRSLRGYLMAGCPVILCVDALKWIRPLAKQLPPPTYQRLLRRIRKLPPDGRLHAVVLIGCRDHYADRQTILAHDSLTSPFVRVSIRHLVHAAGLWSEDRHVCLIAAVPKAVKWGVADVCDEMRRAHRAVADCEFRLYRADMLAAAYLYDALNMEMSSSEQDAVLRALKRTGAEYVWVCEKRTARRIVARFYDAGSRRHPRELGVLQGYGLSIWTRRGAAQPWSLWRRR